MANAVYVLCAFTSALCCALLWRDWRRTGSRLLFWSSLSFAFLTFSNILVFIDLVVWPERDLSIIRSLAAAASAMALVYGLVWDNES
jgi:hypothetical protein